MRPSIKEWHGFTKVWIENVRHLDHEPHYCRLALAMSSSDGQRRDWDFYIAMATQCKAHFEEMEDARLQRRKRVAESLGWTFEFTGHGWKVTTAALELNEPTLVKALAGVEEWGQPLREHWDASRDFLSAARQAMRVAKAIQADLQVIGGAA